MDRAQIIAELKKHHGNKCDITLISGGTATYTIGDVSVDEANVSVTVPHEPNFGSGSSLTIADIKSIAECRPA